MPRSEPTIPRARSDRPVLPATLVALMLACALLSAAGCRQQTSSASKPNATPEQETWDALYVQSAKIGYVHTVVERFTEDDRRLMRLASDSQQQMRRFGKPMTQELSIESIETPDGKLVRFKSTLNVGPRPLVARGEVDGDKLRITVKSQGGNQSSTIDWSDDWGGPFAVEQSLAAKPLAAGQQRSLRALVPILNLVADVSLTALDDESTELLTGSFRLLKVKQTIRLPGGQTVDSLLWIDQTGQIFKMFESSLGQTAYRTSADVALARTDATFDLGEFSVIRLKRPPVNPHDQPRLVYRLHLPDGDPTARLIHCPSQTVRAVDAHTAEVTVQAVQPKLPPALPFESVPPTDDDRTPNSLIQSDDPAVTKIAARVAADETDPWKTAVALEKHVRQSMRSGPVGQAFATAADVAKSLEGDCTEHAVLLAGLCRARGIPARVAMGLVYTAQEQGFAYHMWNEVWIADRWVPLDATLGRGGIGAGHLKLSQSNLKGVAPYAAFLPVLKVLGKLQIEVVK